MRNRYLVVAALLVVGSLQAHSHHSIRPTGLQLAHSHGGVGNERLQAVAALCGAAVALGGTKAACKLTPVRRITGAVGLDPDDVANVVGVSGSCAALSFLASEDVGNGLWRFAQRAPVVGALYALTCSRPAQAFVGNIPMLGTHLVCPDKDNCSGICRKCVMTKGITGTALYLAVDQAINAYTGQR